MGDNELITTKIITTKQKKGEQKKLVKINLVDEQINSTKKSITRLDNFYISTFASLSTIPMGKDRLLPILALILLFIASSSSLYVYGSQTTTDTLQVNGQDYTITQLFSLVKPRSFNDSQYTGIALDDLMQKTGVTNPEQHTYTLKGSDGYEKTVTWTNMQNGLLTEKRESIFSDLPKAFRVKDIVAIEVK
jgi:hypothetical protein